MIMHLLQEQEYTMHAFLLVYKMKMVLVMRTTFKNSKQLMVMKVTMITMMVKRDYQMKV